MMDYWQLSLPHMKMAAHRKITLRFGMDHRNANEYPREEQVVTIPKSGQCQQSFAAMQLHHSSCIDQTIVHGDCCSLPSSSKCGFMPSSQI